VEGLGETFKRAEHAGGLLSGLSRLWVRAGSHTARITIGWSRSPHERAGSARGCYSGLLKDHVIAPNVGNIVTVIPPDPPSRGEWQGRGEPGFGPGFLASLGGPSVDATTFDLDVRQG